MALKLRGGIPVLAAVGVLLAFVHLWGADVIVLTKEDSGKTVTVSAETVIMIALEEKGATGYQWHFDESDIREFAVIDSEAIQPDRPGMVGTPILRMWKLKARKAGTSPLRMHYYRSWEGWEAAVDHFAVTVDTR